MRNRKRRGIALMTAIWILAVLVVMVGGFAAMVHSETQVARNFGQMAQARWAARAGVRRAETEIAAIVSEPYTALDGTERMLASQDEEVTLGDATYEVTITDEAGKINLNTASVEVLTVFFPVEVADAIIDWRDEDSTPEEQGAEEDYYAGLTPPYHCKNQPFDTVGELLLVKDVTPDLLDAPVSDGGPRLRDILTVSSWDTNTDAEGQERINIATASKETLTQEFDGVLTTEDIDAIIAQRTSAAFTSPADLLRVRNLSREKVAQIYDRLTTSTAQDRRGLINVNTAPLEVLAALPGMDEATAQALVDYRTNQGPFETLGDVLSLEQVETSIFEQVANLLTTRSRIFHVSATGQFADGIAQTTTCLLQAEPGAEATTRILYWHE